jgi:outer membrane protein OmpA-like peptidoglycan-associated protein
MKDSLFGFKDETEREEFIVVIPVLLFFAWLGYYLLSDSDTEITGETVAAVSTDFDADGVIDSQDRCTAVAGTIANAGCPERLAFDQQDADGDGVINGRDRCPHTRGTHANNGCAATASAVSAVVEPSAANETVSAQAPDLSTVDTDGDGVPDINDTCPTLAGTTDTGCPPDTDGDTIADAEDRCPALAGVSDNMGCPADTDKDGVFDAADNCPGEAGSADNDGCPAPAAAPTNNLADTDADGVADINDQCPNVASDTDNGCPADSDGDSVADVVDLCPDQPGTSELNGCPPEPDSDEDGVADSIDLCPDRSGEVRFQGCPQDTDADGVSDADDQCPDVSGAIDNNGCPPEANTDSDNDGISDDVDACPLIAGTGADGCPVDSDDDGVADEDDQCPGEFGIVELRGCPESGTAATPETIAIADQRILDEAVANVAFNSSSAILTNESKQILNDVAALMQKYPTAYLEISGHTDSSGSAPRNMDLSMQRARACAEYIAAQGVTVDRLFAYGFGESQPITSNETRDGRRLNRRVEFSIKFP